MKIGDKVICILDHTEYMLLLHFKLSSNKVYKIQEIIDDKFKVNGVKELVLQKFFKLFIPTYNDYLGRSLEIDDKVVFVLPGYREYKKGIIKKFTNKYVFVEYSSDQSYPHEIKQTSDQLIKIL